MINMLVTSTSDGPAICTHSKTHNTANTTLLTNPSTPSTNDKVNAHPPLTEDQKETLRLMQRTYPFCKCISKRLLHGNAPSHEIDTFTHFKGLIYKHDMDSNQRFLALVTPKSWCFTVLVEAYDRLGHQGVTRTYQHYYWKSINKDICKYINNCALCKREKAKAQVYPLHMTDMPDRPFDKIAIDLVSDLNISTSRNQYILTINDHLT